MPNKSPAPNCYRGFNYLDCGQASEEQHLCADRGYGYDDVHKFVERARYIAVGAVNRQE